MKLKVLLAFIISCVSFILKAQNNEGDTITLKTAINQFTKAMIDADSVTLDKLTANNLSYGHSGGQVQNKAAFIHSLTSGASDFVTIDIKNQTILLFNNTAVVRYFLSAATNDNNNTGSVKLFVLLVWQSESNEWKLIARQAVKQQ